jgi:hypothetical protein
MILPRHLKKQILVRYLAIYKKNMSASMYQNNSKQRFGYDTIIIIVGIFILLFHLIDNPSLWGDEIALALNIVKYDLPTLLTTPSLDYLQSAPPGYLFFVKIFSYLGPHDWCLRLAATLATAFAFWTFNKLLKLLFEAYWLRCVVLLLFVASPTVLFHGVELKQYAFDLLANTLLLHAVVHFLQQLRPTLKDYGYLAAVGLGGVWFSNALYFSLAGLGILLFVKQWQKKTIDKLLWVVLGAWVLGILANYVLCVLPNKNVAGFVVFWQAEFPPLPVSAAGLRWYFLRIFFLFDNAFGLSSPLSLFVKVSPKWSFLLCFNYAAFALVLLGLWHLWRQKKWLLGIFTLPLLVAYALALLQKYPFYERFLLFYTPALYAIIGYGLWWCWQNGGRWAAQVATFLLLLYPLSTTLWAVLKPNTFALYEGYNYGNLRELRTFRPKNSLMTGFIWSKASIMATYTTTNSNATRGNPSWTSAPSSMPTSKIICGALRPKLRKPSRPWAGAFLCVLRPTKPAILPLNPLCCPTKKKKPLCKV